MFYYYEKAGKLLASERRDLPYLKAEPAPGTPICYLVEGRRAEHDAVRPCLGAAAARRPVCAAGREAPGAAGRGCGDLLTDRRNRYAAARL